MKILPYQINLIVKCRINYKGELEAVRKLLNHLNLMVTQSRRLGIVCLCLCVFMYVLWANKVNRCNRQCEGRIGKSLPTDCRLQWRRIQQKLYLSWVMAKHINQSFRRSVPFHWETELVSDALNFVWSWHLEIKLITKRELWPSHADWDHNRNK